MVESPLTGTKDFAFVRTLAPLANRTALCRAHRLRRHRAALELRCRRGRRRASRQLVNAADQTSPVAPGGLINVFGNNLSPVNLATNEVPLPTALADSCLTVNGVPVPMLFVSLPAQINAQLPFNVDGSATMVLRTPGGISDNYLFSILPAAPSVFRNGTAGPETGIATIIRAENNRTGNAHESDPSRRHDYHLRHRVWAGPPRLSTRGSRSVQSAPDRADSAGGDTGRLAVSTTFAGLAPGQIGVYQINATVPKGGVPEGMPIPLVIKQGGSETQIDVRVVK